MTVTKTPEPSSDETDEPKLEQVQYAQQSQGKPAPRPVQRTQLGRKPLFRN